MTFRTRILLACLAVAVIPLTLFAFGVRSVVRERLSAQFEERVTASITIIRAGLARSAADIDAQLRALADLIDDDAELRAALLQRGERAALLDYAGRVMGAANLDYLLLLDADGTVLSSGHFRNEFDRSMPAAHRLLAADGPTLVATRRAQGTFLALVRARAFTIGPRRLILAGGNEIDAAFVNDIARNAAGALVVSLDYAGGSMASEHTDAIESGSYTEQIALPYIDDVAGEAETTDAHWTVTHSLAPLRAVLRGIDMSFLVAIAGAALLAVIIAHVVAARVNRPLEELARKSTRVDLDRGDVQLATRRPDEIGTLSRMLDNMVHRLRTSAHELRAAERRATVGDLARQVNHDIRNGLLPIRNVIRHLTEVAHDAPAELGSVFAERASTLHGGIGYLESLATNYARLSPRTERQTCDVNAIVHTVLEHSTIAGDTRIRLDLSGAAPRVTADPVALRRVIENLLINAVESLPTATGTVTVTTTIDADATDRLVTLTVADTGIGIEPAALDRVFDDFYTTKERGTGLGLSIVRRLVADMGGRIRVESERNRGTTFRVELPEAS